MSRLLSINLVATTSAGKHNALVKHAIVDLSKAKREFCDGWQECASQMEE